MLLVFGICCSDYLLGGSWYLFFVPVTFLRLVMVCPWPFMAALDSKVAPSLKSGKTFAQALSGSSNAPLNQLHLKVIIGDSVRIRVTQQVYESALLIANTISMDDYQFTKETTLSLHKL